MSESNDGRLIEERGGGDSVEKKDADDYRRKFPLQRGKAAEFSPLHPEGKGRKTSQGSER